MVFRRHRWLGVRVLVRVFLVGRGLVVWVVGMGVVLVWWSGGCWFGL